MITSVFNAATIIGGADGPTAIFVANKMSMPTLVIILLVAGAVVGFIAGMLYRHFKK